MRREWTPGFLIQWSLWHLDLPTLRSPWVCDLLVSLLDLSKHIVSQGPAPSIAAPGAFVEAEEGLLPFSAELEAAAFAARTPADLLALDLTFLDHLVPRLRGADPVWTPRARIARAFHCGVVAGRRLGGEIVEGTSPGLPFRNSFYVCLRGPGNTAGFWTADFGKYINRVGSGRNSFHPDSVSHAFPSRAEGEAYLAGARVQWPAEARWSLFLRF